jgi:hypothetical protein
MPNLEDVEGSSEYADLLEEAESRVAGWIEEAKGLERAVHH